MIKKAAFFSGNLFSCPILLIVFIVISNIINAQPTNQTFNSSGTYTVPVGYTASVNIEAWGAGGGGGSNTGGAKGGGGGGAYASSTTTLTAGSYTVTVGTGGGAGTAGGNSSFTTLVIAEGGSSTAGTTGGTGGTTAGSTGTTKVAGVNGANTSGNNGGAGGAGANGGGAGGAGGIANNGSGSAGTAAGGGGGGKAGPGAGGLSGAGANGRVIVTVLTLLPVKFGKISAYEKEGGINIDWTVYSEENLRQYEIERSADSKNFSAITIVSARNVTTETKYSWLDVNPLSGISFYRLKSIDIDGKAGYSSIVKINLNKSLKDFSIYPNPVIGKRITIAASAMEAGRYDIVILNLSGQKLTQSTIDHSGGAFTLQVSISDGIKAGLYLLKFIGKEQSFSKSFLVE